MHLVIYNCGTGDSGYRFAKTQAQYAENLQQHNTQTLIVNGCHHEDVCNNGMTPDLAGFANRFASKVFTKNENGKLILSKPSSDGLAKLKVGIQPTNHKWIADYEAQEIRLVPKNHRNTSQQEDMSSRDGQDAPSGDENAFENQNEPIESITFVGYSRGAVTCFNMAKAMEKIAPDVPIHIVADQPVPGNLYATPGTNARSIADCSKLKNVKSVDLTIGAYTGIFDEGDLGSKLRGLFHRLFFSQIIPKLPQENCRTNLSVIPRTDHWSSKMSGDAHVHMYLTRQLADRGLIDKDIAEEYENQVKDFYKENKPAFPEAKHLQTTFGANAAKMYDHVDKHYIENLNNEEYQTFLYNWWQAQETQSSRFSTKLTKDLVKAMKEPNANDENKKLLDIFKNADEWLMIKESSGSSRYNQVMKLREQVRERLLVIDPENKIKMDESNIQSLQKTHYFEKRWQRESKAASWFKTDATRELDKAFKEHGQAEMPSKENDEKLLQAIDKWIDAKKPLEEGAKISSRRFELVVNMKKQLEAVIDQYPSQEASQEFKM